MIWESRRGSWRLEITSTDAAVPSGHFFAPNVAPSARRPVAEFHQHGGSVSDAMVATLTSTTAARPYFSSAGNYRRRRASDVTEFPAAER